MFKCLSFSITANCALSLMRYIRRLQMFLWCDRQKSLFEETLDVSELGLEGIVIRAVLTEETTIVGAVLKETLWCATLLEVCVALLAGPCQEVLTRLSGYSP
jgi:hypothetical protein